MGFGQGIGAFLLNGVLGGQHKERLLKLVGLARHGDALFLHGFEQGGLRLGRRAVDLVSQNDVGEDGAFDELKLSRLVQDLGAYNVGRHQVGGELDTAETQAQSFSNRID